MTIALLANDAQKKEWLSKTIPSALSLIWADSVRSLTMIEADAYFDLQFHPDPERTARLQQFGGKPFFIDAVPYTTAQTGNGFIRINGWPTQLQRPVIEIVLPKGVTENDIQPVFSALQWRYQLVPDIPGMITPRILAMIINEAYYTLGSGVSTKEEIDIAMKLGTNYPLGPFEWSEAIGLEKVFELLKTLARTDARYAVAPALEAAIREKTGNK